MLFRSTILFLILCPLYLGSGDVKVSLINVSIHPFISCSFALAKLLLYYKIASACTVPTCKIFQLPCFNLLKFSSVQFSRSVVSDSLRPHELQHARPPCPSPTPGVYSNPCPSSQWCHPLLSPSPPAPNLSQHQGLFQWVNTSHEVAKVLEFQLQHQSFQCTPQDWSPCSPRDSQESSPTPKLRSVVLNKMVQISLMMVYNWVIS